MKKEKKELNKHGKKQKQSGDLFLKGMRPFIWIAAIAFLAYLPTLWFGYSPLDDFTLIVKRLDWLKDIRHFPDIFTKGIFFAEDAKVPDYYRPLLTVTFMIDVLIGKGSPVICHLTNVLIHIGASFLCFTFLNQIIENKKLSFLFAVLFAVHPILTHAVAWIPGRNDSLMALFIFSSAIFYLKYIRNEGKISLLLSGLMYMAALFTKENAIIFLPLIGLLDYIVTGKINVSKLIIPFFLFAVLTLVWWTIRARVVVAVPYTEQMQKPGLYIGLLAPMLIFLQKSFLPIQQSVFSNVKDTSLIPSFIVLAFLMYVVTRQGLKNKRLAWFGLAWYFLFLLIPTLHALFNGLSDIHFEHRLYIPLAGLFIATSQIRLPFEKYFYVFVIVIAVFFIKTISRSFVYENSYSFAIAAAEESPDLANVYNIRGNEYNNLGRFNEAIEDYTHGLKLDSARTDMLFNRANSLKALKEYKLSLADYNKGLKKDSLNAKAFFDRGNVYFDLEDYQKAIADYDRAIKIYPYYSNAWNNRGNALSNLKIFEEAINNYSRAIEFRPGNAKAWNNRGNAYSELGKNEAALNDYNKAIELDPKEKDYRQNRDGLAGQMNRPKHEPGKQDLSFMEEQLLPRAYELYRSGDYRKALDIFQQLEKIAADQGNVKTQLSHLNNSGLCYMKMNDLKKAENIFSQMVLQHPEYVNAYSNLSLIYKKQGNIRLAKDFMKKALALEPDNVKFSDELKTLELMNKQ